MQLGSCTIRLSLSPNRVPRVFLAYAIYYENINKKQLNFFPFNIVLSPNHGKNGQTSPIKRTDGSGPHCQSQEKQYYQSPWVTNLTIFTDGSG